MPNGGLLGFLAIFGKKIPKKSKYLDLKVKIVFKAFSEE